MVKVVGPTIGPFAWAIGSCRGSNHESLRAPLSSERSAGTTGQNGGLSLPVWSNDDEFE
jgi:hypothetical protein